MMLVMQAFKKGVYGLLSYDADIVGVV